MGDRRETSKGTERGIMPGMRRGKPRRSKLLIASAVALAVAGISVYLAHAGGSGQNGMPIQAVWIEPQVVAGAVSIPVNQVENNRNVHFKIEDETGELHFMAYTLNGEIHLRASICPPCRGIGYSLDGDVLVCDTCATTFGARTGDGIKGACVNYPKAAVPFEIVDGSMVATQSDLLVAYERTLEPGWP